MLSPKLLPHSALIQAELENSFPLAEELFRATARPVGKTLIAARGWDSVPLGIELARLLLGLAGKGAP